LQKEYYKTNGNYKGVGKYSDKYVMWLENELLALRQPIIVGRSKQMSCRQCGQLEPCAGNSPETCYHPKVCC